MRMPGLKSGPISEAKTEPNSEAKTESAFPRRLHVENRGALVEDEAPGFAFEAPEGAAEDATLWGFGEVGEEGDVG